MNKFMEEKTALRNEAMEMVLPRFNAAFAEALKVPHNNEWYIPVDMGEGKPSFIKVVMSVPEWVDTEKRPAFDFDTCVAKAEQKYLDNEAKRAANAEKRANATSREKVDNTVYDAKVLEYFAEHLEATTAKDFYEAHEWDEGETKGKLISALTRLSREGKIVCVPDKPANKWILA